MKDSLITRRVRNDRFRNNIVLFALACYDCHSHMCSVDTKLKSLKYGYRSARKRFVHVSGVYGDLLGFWMSLPTTEEIDLLFAPLEDE